MISNDLKIDIFICVGSRDVDRLFVESLTSCLKNFSFLSQLFIVTPDKKKVAKKIQSLKITKKVTLLNDQEVLESFLHGEDGWYKQQIIKLKSYEICTTPFIACLSSDTILLQAIQKEDLFSSSGLPILYYKKHDEPSSHYEYEKQRLNAIEKILKVKLVHTREFTDFILDFMIWDRKILNLLNQYLFNLYGEQAYKVLSPGLCDTLAKKTEFGEWSLYAAFVLDVLKLPIEVKGFQESYFFQIHSEKDLKRFQGDSKIVHYVSKDFNLGYIKNQLQSRARISS